MGQHALNNKNVPNMPVFVVIIRSCCFFNNSPVPIFFLLSWWGDTSKIKFPYLAPVAPQVFGNDIRACIPERLNGRDTDLLAAEAAFDVLENTLIHPDGMSIN